MTWNTRMASHTFWAPQLGNWSGRQLDGSLTVLYYSSALILPYKQVKVEAAIPLKGWA